MTKKTREFSLIYNLVKYCSFKENWLRNARIQLRCTSTCESPQHERCWTCKQQEHRIEMREFHRKRRRRHKTRSASCASATLQRGRDFMVASTDKSVKDAVASREEGINTVTTHDILPPKANGSKQRSSTWSLPLPSPSSTTSISPSTTSTRRSRENYQTKGAEVENVLYFPTGCC